MNDRVKLNPELDMQCEMIFFVRHDISELLWFCSEAHGSDVDECNPII